MTKYLVISILLAILCSGFVRNKSGKEYRFPRLTFFPEMPKPDHAITDAGVDLGRHLFYDPILSRDSNMSCASCHKQQFAFSDAPNRFSAGNNRIALRRNTLPIFNLAWHQSFFWDGKASSIEGQVFHPVNSDLEMNLSWSDVVSRLKRHPTYKRKFKAAFGDVPIDSDMVSNAIGQFERTLLSYRSKYDRVINGRDSFTKDESEGFLLCNDMTEGDCLHCHTTDSDPLGSTFAFSNNGLDMIKATEDFVDRGRGDITRSPFDNGKFKIPSLRNLAFTPPYMHDGRFQTLEQVVDFYSEGVKMSPTIDSKMEYVHQGGARLTLDEKRMIIAFLQTLTDSLFVSDPNFSDPFVSKKKR